MKKIAIIGRPNVGKSSFFNRLLREKDAITSEEAGTTRDVIKRVLDLFGQDVELIDTGGLDGGNELFDKIREKSMEAAYRSDIIIYMVDGRDIPDEKDKKIFYELESLGKDVCLVVNKLDNDKLEENLWNYYEFGSSNMFAVSVSHNRHIIKVMEWIATCLPDLEIKPKIEKNEEELYEDFINQYEDEEEIEIIDDQIRVAIIGRVNVGKSSLLNSLIKEERSVVSSIAGTTIDPIDEMVKYEDKEITFIDTAGLRKRGKILGIEKYALMRTEAMLKNANLALLVLDSSEPFKDLDEKIAGLIDKNRLACLIVVNKWDISKLEYAQLEEQIRDRFKFLHYAEIITISALTNQRVHKIFDMILEINKNYTQRISTSKVNEVIRRAVAKHAIPSHLGSMIRIYFATQYDIKPPKIVLSMNKPQYLHFSYRRYLTNEMRKAFNFRGTPVLFKAKKRGNTEIEEEADNE